MATLIFYSSSFCFFFLRASSFALLLNSKIVYGDQNVTKWRKRSPAVAGIRVYMYICIFTVQVWCDEVVTSECHMYAERLNGIRTDVQSAKWTTNSIIQNYWYIILQFKMEKQTAKGKTKTCWIPISQHMTEKGEKQNRSPTESVCVDLKFILNLSSGNRDGHSHSDL